MSKTRIESPHLDSDMMHNHNCFYYLLQLQAALNPTMSEKLPALESVANLKIYNKNFPYGDLYTKVISGLEEIIKQLPPDQLDLWDDLILAIYHNDNHILEKIQGFIKPISDLKRPDSDTSKQIVAGLSQHGPEINHSHPQKTEELFHKVTTIVSPNFKPQHETNIPSLITYPYKKGIGPTEYRFCTQAQREHNKVRISPLFERWLHIKANKTRAEQPISHVYFNLLGLDRSSTDIAGSLERGLSLELHKLDNKPALKTAVFTLPANKGLMDSSDYKKTNDKHSIDLIFYEFLNIALMQGNGVTDFWNSYKTRALLFKDAVHQDTILRKLLIESFMELGFTPIKTPFLTSAQKQAVWVHFIKFKLTQYILDTLKPNGYNFTCKDAIDRGAVASAYFNLMKSFAADQPLTKEEFERALDSPATVVRGRGMNFHRKIIWNALDVYVTAHYKELINDPRKAWLIYWRDMNCPHSRVKKLLHERLGQFKYQFDNLPDGPVKTAGLNICKGVKTQIDHQVNGKRILLEILSRTSELIYEPSPEIRGIYRQRAIELRIEHECLYTLGGLMEAFLGVLLFLPSIGYSKPMISSGWASAKTGFFASDRNALSNQMLLYLSNSQVNQVPISPLAV